MEEHAQEARTPRSSNHVHVSLRTGILIGALVGGTAIGVKAMAKKYRVRRGIVLEAVAQLEDEGLVERKSDNVVVVAEDDSCRLGDPVEAAAQWRRRTEAPEATPGSDFP